MLVSYLVNIENTVWKPWIKPKNVMEIASFIDTLQEHKRLPLRNNKIKHVQSISFEKWTGILRNKNDNRIYNLCMATSAYVTYMPVEIRLCVNLRM